MPLVSSTGLNSIEAPLTEKAEWSPEKQLALMLDLFAAQMDAAVIIAAIAVWAAIALYHKEHRQ